MKEKTGKESLQIFQIKDKISTMLSQNVFQSRGLRSELLFQDPQLSSQIEFHKNKYNFDKNVYSTVELPNPNQYPFTVTKFQHRNTNAEMVFANSMYSM